MSSLLTPMSYTNKDFGDIYVELLDLVKQLSAKWDPTISNESDPGVILLKADAIIADKNNYNIDKNILELFPETVTQEINARNIYKQLGYIMPWYQSATGIITMRWKGKELVNGATATIPKYTMFTNEEGYIVYTLLEDIVFKEGALIQSGPIQEGTIQTLTVSGDNNITINNLDASNRIYLSDYMVAENGLFITNTGRNNTWEQVDNLYIKPTGSNYYEFGVDSRNFVCYLQFPDDITSLIKSGLSIKYLLSSGAAGNISAKALDRFYNESSIQVAGETVLLDTDSVELYNPSACTDGKDPESITDAFKSYRKTAGTFNTLVTVRDYINAVYNSGLVSNGIVTDRITDPQSTYYIITEDEVNGLQPCYVKGTDGAIKYMKKHFDAGQSVNGNYFRYSPEGDTPFIKFTGTVTKDTDLYYKEDAHDDMSAFDLRLYLLHNPGTVDSVEKYNASFEVLASGSKTVKEVQGFLYNEQSIQHDFSDILPNAPFLFKNVYNLDIKILPQFILTTEQQYEVRKNIVTALWNICNSRAVEFGERPDYNTLYDCVQNSDERIKAVILSDLEYTTFACYWDDNKKTFKEIPITDKETPMVIRCNSYEDAIAYNRSSDKTKREKYKKAYFVIVNDHNKIYKYDEKKKEFVLYSEYYDTFRKDIVVKSILAGITPLFKEESDFKIGINHQFIDEVSADRVSTHLVIRPFATEFESQKKTAIDFNGDGEADFTIPISVGYDDEAIEGKYKLQANESIRFLGPSFITTTNYSNYVKFELVLGQSTGLEKTAIEYSRSQQPGTKYLIPTASYYDALFHAVNGAMFEWESSDNNTSKYALTTKGGTLCLSADGDRVIAKSFSNPDFNWYESNGQIMYQVPGSDPKYLAVDDDNNLFLSNNISKGWVKTSVQIPFSYFHSEGIVRAVEVSNYIFPNNNELSPNCEYNVLYYNSKLTKGYFWTNDELGSKIHEVSLTSDSFIYNSEDRLQLQVDDAYIVEVVSLNTNDEDCSPVGLEDIFKYSYTITDWEGDTTYTYDTNASSTASFIVNKYWEKGLLSVYQELPVYKIDANEEYQLRQNDYITFYWREEDDTEAPYRYKKYSGTNKVTSTSMSPIIKPSFAVRGTDITGSKVNPILLPGSEGYIEYGTGNFNTVAGFYGDTDLSGSKQIEIRNMNQVTLDDADKYYFITNNIDEINNKYLLPLRQFGEPFIDEENRIQTVSYRYSLEAEETFIRSDRKQAEFEMMDGGTLVLFDVTYPYPYVDMSGNTTPPPKVLVKSCTIVDSDTVTHEGATSFIEHLLLIETNEKVTVREQQMYNLVEGDTIVVNKHNYTGKSAVEFVSWVDTIIDDGLDISYTLSDNSTGKLPKVNVIAADAMWHGKAAFNLDVDNKNGQSYTLLSKDYKSSQFVFVKDSNGNWKIPLSFNLTESFTLEDLNKPCYLQTSFPLLKVGGSNIDVTYVDGLGDRKDNEMYFYSLNDVFDKDPFIIDVQGTIHMKVSPKDEITEGINLSLAKGSKYILAIKNPTDSLTYTLSGPGDNITGLNVITTDLGLNVITTEPLSRGIAYFQIKGSDASLELKINIRNTSDTDQVLTFHQLIKHSNTELFDETSDTYSGFTFDEVLSRLRELDYRGIFKYNYVVSQDKLIENPLDANTFLDVNHIMNPYTIAKAECVLNSLTGSKINIINNKG